MKVTVIGAGAVGSWFGGLLAHHHPRTEVLFLARGPHREQIHRTGRVILKGRGGARNAPVTIADDVAQIAGSDFVLLTVKSRATEDAIRSSQPHLGNATVISIQNGINQHVLTKYLPPERLVMGVTATNMAILEPGTVNLQRDGPSLLGPPSQEMSMDQTQKAVRMLRTTGMTICSEPNILGAQYNKMAFNALGCAAALSESNIISDGILHDRWRACVAVPLHRECKIILEQAGIEITRTPGLSDVYRFGRLLQTLGAPISGKITKGVARMFFSKRPVLFSVYLDLKAGKPTEVESINGEIVRLAQKCGCRAPYNEKVVELVHELERREARMFLPREEVIARFMDLTRDTRQETRPVL